MRLTLGLLIAALMQVSAAGYAQKVTLDQKHAELKTVLSELRKQSNFDFLYTDEQLQQAHPVDINVRSVELKDVLEQIFKDQPLTYTIDERTVVIKEKGFFEKLKNNISKVFTPPLTISGLVTNKANEPLIGATIVNKRTKTGTTTDNNGFYTLTNIEPTDSLIIRYIGYKTITVGIGKIPFVNVKLEESTSSLDEVVVQGYGHTTQRLTTGSIGRVTAADIEKQPVNDLLLSLTGKVPGVIVTPQSGYDDGPIKIEIRGRNAINSAFSTDPLYIIDGVPLTVLDVSGTNTNVSNSLTGISKGLDQSGLSYSLGQSPLYGINPLDIESIEVLKDADATAIYGSRAANGVILITTKKGKPGATQLSINAQDGVTFETRALPLLNTQDYLSMRREQFRNDGIVPTAANAPDLVLGDPNRYTNWEKYLYGGLGNKLNAQMSLSGGTEQTTFRLSAGYNNTHDITSIHGSDQKATLAFAVNSVSGNKKLTTTFTVNFSYANVNQLNLNGATNLPPNAPDVYDAAGNLNFAGYHAVGLTYPFNSILRPYNSNVTGITSNLTVKYNIIKGLNAAVSLGYNNNQNYEQRFTPIASQSPYTTTPLVASSQFGNTHVTNWIVEPQLTYNRLIGSGTLDVLAGATLQDNSTDGTTQTGSNYTSDIFIRSIGLAPTQTITDNYGQYKYAGIFARINYVWDNKYIFNLNGRRDGSSRFGPGNQFGNFGSVGLGWIVSDEKWFKKALPKAISYFKLRASYGITGSDLVGDYQYLAQWGNNNPVLTTYNGVTPLSPQLAANPDFHWQVNKKLDAAVDMEFLDGKYGISVDYYRNRCDNQLVSLQTPEFTGFTSVTANNPANVENSGIELSFTANVIQNTKIRWNNSFNIAVNHNKLLAYPGLETSPYRNQYQIGQSLNLQHLLHFIGIDPLTGTYVYQDANGDGKISTSTAVISGTQYDDAVVTVDREPTFTGGWTSTFSYKTLTLTMGFNFAKQRGINLINTGASNSGIGATNIAQFVYDHRWTYPGQTDALYGKMTTGITAVANVNSSDAGWTDASYFRFQTITLSYGLPAKILKKIGVHNLSVNVSTNNLFVITAYKGYDPQITSFGGLPPARTVVSGLTATF